MNWTRDEFLAYLLLYAANSNFEEANLERNVIISKVDMQTFQKIHDEFDADNDYQSLQKIQDAIERLNYSSEDIDELLSEIQVLFYSDGDFDLLERNMFTFLKRLLK